MANSLNPLNNSEVARTTAMWSVLIPAAMIMVLTMGSRQVTGLFLSPMNTSTGIGLAGLSFAVAVGHFVWGASQPLFGVLADRFGAVAVMMFGGVLLALGLGVTPLMTGQWGMVFSMGLLTAAGSGAASFALLFALAAQRLPADKQSFSGGFINAGGSMGQFLLAPITERLIALTGWMNAMYALAAASLLTLPLVWSLRERKSKTQSLAIDKTRPVADPKSEPRTEPKAKDPPGALKAQLKTAFTNRSYLLLHIGFFTCGFHVAFLITHLPGEVALCGLPATVSGYSIALIGLANIVGALGAGSLGSRYRLKDLLFWIYWARALIIIAYMLAPKVPLTFYMFSIGLGLTFLATVGPTAGLVGKLFGVRYLATLFGFTLLSHQIGGFLGAWLGGLAVVNLGSYNVLWYADALLALIAALVHMPIKEARPGSPGALAASSATAAAPAQAGKQANG
ncbi:MAG: MFS transporter [Burkholderiaceae bacterium]